MATKGKVKKNCSMSNPSRENISEKIRKRAQELFEKRVKGNISGDALGDWFEAEKQIKAEMKK
jgi:hypothetical protein